MYQSSITVPLPRHEVRKKQCQHTALKTLSKSFEIQLFSDLEVDGQVGVAKAAPRIFFNFRFGGLPLFVECGNNLLS